MKILYIESKLKNLKSNLTSKEIAKLPKKIMLAYSLQYKELADIIKKKLENHNIKIIDFKQVLGCSRLNKKNYTVLFIGSGKFHAINLFLQSSEIYILENGRITKISKIEIESFKKKRKTALIKFLLAKKIGILVSIKPGQENMKIAERLKQEMKAGGKQVFIFLTNNIDTGQFENFDIDSWVNTACPGLYLDNSDIINYSEINQII